MLFRIFLSPLHSHTMKINTLITKNLLLVAWIQSLAATLGSLYYSEIKHFTPCILCWYQRIFMYPLVLILAIGILKKNKHVDIYALPMSIVGWFIALYHVLLQKGILSEAIAPCVLGASCATKYTGYFGFITIPVMSITAYSVIIACLLAYRKWGKK